MYTIAYVKLPCWLHLLDSSVRQDAFFRKPFNLTTNDFLLWYNRVYIWPLKSNSKFQDFWITLELASGMRTGHECLEGLRWWLGKEEERDKVEIEESRAVPENSNTWKRNFLNVIFLKFMNFVFWRNIPVASLHLGCFIQWVLRSWVCSRLCCHRTKAQLPRNFNSSEISL